LLIRSAAKRRDHGEPIRRDYSNRHPGALAARKSACLRLAHVGYHFLFNAFDNLFLTAPFFQTSSKATISSSNMTPGWTGTLPFSQR
jgi:hypothetical protein